MYSFYKSITQITPFFALFLGTSFLLISDNIFALALAIVLLASLISFNKKLFRKFQTLDIIFMLFLSIYPLVVILSMYTRGLPELQEFDTPSRFLLIIPIYIWLRNNLKNLNIILLSSTVACLIAFMYAMHELYEIQQGQFSLYTLRAAGAHNPIEFAQMSLLVTAISCMPLLLIKNITVRKLIATLIIFLGTATIIATQTRGVIIFTPLLLSSLWVFRKEFQLTKFNWCILITSYISASSYLIMTSDKLHRLRVLFSEISKVFQDSDYYSSTGERAELWQHSLKIISDAPFWGQGKGQFNQALVDIVGSESNLTGYHSHNELLFITAELGIFGACSVITLYFGILFIAIKKKFTKQSIYIISMVSITWFLFGLTSVQLVHHTITLFQLWLLALGFSYGMNQKYGLLKKKS